MRLLLHLAMRRGAEDSFGERLRDELTELRRRARSAGCEVVEMSRVPDDPFGRKTPFSATVEVRAPETATPETLVGLVDRFGGRLGSGVHRDLCTALVGRDHVFTPFERTPVRYQYLMRRQAGFTHDSYLKRYAEIHSRFGVRTPGHRGYVQLHVDLEASREAAATTGFGVCEVDSVSELYLESVEGFLSEIARSPLGREAMADEELFVDRKNSIDLCSDVRWDA